VGLLLLHAAVTWFLTGLIWTVQIVHYPLFAAVGRDGFARYEADHARRITWIVAPLMSLELLSGAWLALVAPTVVASGLAWSGLALIVLLWASTALLQVPCHRRLSAGYDEGAHRRLVASNWLRTAAWSLRSLLVAAMLWVAA
jgi:hypothetical protein